MKSGVLDKYDTFCDPKAVPGVNTAYISSIRKHLMPVYDTIYDKNRFCALCDLSRLYIYIYIYKCVHITQGGSFTKNFHVEIHLS